MNCGRDRVYASLYNGSFQRLRSFHAVKIGRLAIVQLLQIQIVQLVRDNKSV